MFCTLPIGVEAGGVNCIGNLPAAPKQPRLKFKMILTTILSAVVWIVIYIIIQMDVINFHDIATQMSAADHSKITSN